MMRTACSVILLSVVFLLAPSADALTAAWSIARVRATGVWRWNTRMQQVDIVQKFDGEIWRQALLSVERRTLNEEYAQVSVLQQPRIMYNMRILGLWDAHGRNDRWLYADELHRARRLPSMEADGAMGRVFTALATIQELPYIVQDANSAHLEARGRPDAFSLIERQPRLGAATVELDFDGPEPVLRRIVTRDADSGPIQEIHLESYAVVQGIPTPLAMRVYTVADGGRTRIRFSDVAYDVSIGDDLFSVAQFGSAELPVLNPSFSPVSNKTESLSLQGVVHGNVDDRSIR